MFQTLPRAPRILLASAVVLTPSAPSVALTQSSSPRSAAEVPVPSPFPCVPISLCRKLGNDANVVGPAYLQLTTVPGESKQISVLAWDWGALDPPRADSSDPQEGGEVVRNADSVGTAPTPTGKRRPSRDTIGEVVTKKTDKSSPVIFSTGGSEPHPVGTLTVRIARGSAAAGTRIPDVRLSAKGRVYHLRNVAVTECAATDDNTDTCTLSYQSLGG